MIHDQTKFPFNSNFFLDRQAGLPIENEMDWDNHDGRSRPYQYTWTPLPNTNVGNNFIFSATRDGQLHAGHGIEPRDWVDLYIGSISYPFEVLSIENNHEIRVNLNGLTGPFSGFKKRIDPGMNFDPDALGIIRRIENADGEELWNGMREAINELVLEAKSANVWNNTAQFTMGAAARTVSGSLVPWIGPAMANNNFILSDYDPKNGLRGNALNKNLVGVEGNLFGQDDFLSFSYITSPPSTGTTKAFLGNGTASGHVGLLKSGAGDQLLARTKASANFMSGLDGKLVSGLIASARNSPTNGFLYANNQLFNTLDSSTGNLNNLMMWFSTTNAVNFSDSRMMAYYYGPYSNPDSWNSIITNFYNKIQTIIP